MVSDETLQDKVGERIYSRLVEMCRFVKLEGIDYRQEMQGNKPPPRVPQKEIDKTTSPKSGLRCSRLRHAPK